MRNPIEVITAVEDWIDYPPATVSRSLAERILEALEREGWAIVPANQTDYGSNWRK